jgi:hypothetical protein
MYNDVNLPEEEAWSAMSADLRKTKESRNALTKENGYVSQSHHCSEKLTNAGQSPQAAVS